MSEIIELLSELPRTSFSFDQRTKLFHVGERVYSVAEAFDDPWRLRVKEGDIPASKPVVEVLPLLRFVGHPSFYDWLCENDSAALHEEVCEVMVDAFYGTVGEVPSNHARSLQSTLFGFSMERLRREHPHFALSTLGNCACFGVDPDGLFGQHIWRERYMSFSEHNIDTPQQKISIYAGLGFLARRAMNEIT